MSKTKSFLGGAAIAIQLGAADAATIPPGSSGLITDIKTTSSLGDIDPRLAGKPVLGQQRFIPSAGDRPEETTQVYQVRDNFALACQAAGGPVSSKAYTAGVYDQVIAAGSLNVLTTAQ